MTSRKRTSRRMRMNRHTSRRLYANAKKRPSLNDSFLAGYVEAMLFSSTDNRDESGGLPLDRNYTDRDITTDSLIKMAKQCRDFENLPGVADAIATRAEEAGRDHRFEVLVRRGNEANAHFERSRSTDPLNLAILDGAEDLGLRWE